MSKKDQEICYNCAHWRPDHKYSTYGVCLLAFTCKLITPFWHPCSPITFKFKLKEAANE